MFTIDPSYQVLYSELMQRSLDAAFSSDFSLDGRFIRQTISGRTYWYFDIQEDGKKKRRYVGPEDDAAITQRVEHFKNLKADYRGRRKLVSTLTREARLPSPPPFVGTIVGALASSGFFRLRGVLVGTVAFQCYSAGLGVRLPSTTLQTADADFAQFHSISVAVNDAIPNVLGTLQEIDPTFRAIPHIDPSSPPSKYAARNGYKVEFLTPNTGSDDHQGKTTSMPALGAAGAEPLRFLDFLIYEPVRAVLLHEAGIPVLVPAPERYAVHKLIVANRRKTDANGAEKARKDLHQAQTLMEALIETHQRTVLADAYSEAWRRGKAWRDAIEASMLLFPDAARTHIRANIADGIRAIGDNPKDLGIA